MPNYTWCNPDTLRDDCNGYSKSCPAQPQGQTFSPEYHGWGRNDTGERKAGTLQLLIAILKGKNHG
jgi:hypothetical protein